MKKLIMLTVGLLASNGILAMDPATLMAIGSMMPKEINFSMSFTQYKQKTNQTCFGTVSNDIYNDRGTVQIGVGECTLASGQQMGSMGKAGDVTLIPFDNLRRINFDTVAKAKINKFQVPQASRDWENAIAFSFKPTLPKVSSALKNWGFTDDLFKGRAAQVVVRSRQLTPDLADKEGYANAFRENNNQLLVEVWARVYPSITGSPEFKQVFNFVIPAEDAGKEIGFAAEASGFAALARRLQDGELVLSSFNVLDAH